MRLSSTSHSPSLLPSPPPPPHLPPAAAAAAALRRARTPQCKDCSSITIGARQGLDGYIVQLDSLIAQASPHVSNQQQLVRPPSSTRPPPPTHPRSPLFLAHVSLTPCVWCSISFRMRVGCNPGDRCLSRRDAHARKT